VRLRIQHTLFGGFLGVTGLLVLLLTMLVTSGLRRDLVGTFEDELERVLSLGTWILEHSEQESSDSVARAITELIGYRVSIIDTAGVVLGDSYVAPERMLQVENHRGRPEVQGALAGRVSYAQRTSATVDQPLLYAAVLARFRDTPVVLRVAAPLDNIDRTVARVRRTVTLTGLAAMAVALLLAYALSVGLARPLVVLADRARQLAAGDFSTRVPRGASVAELSELSSAFNRLADELQARLSELRRDRDEMGALIDTMAEGVIALDVGARVLRVNRSARSLLGLPSAIESGAPVGALVRQRELRDLLEESVVHSVQTREIRLDDHVLLAASRRLDLGGAVTTFLDITETRRLEQVRRDFVANASHELKTPLTAIRGYAEALLEDDPPENLRRDFLASIRNNSVRLQRLVDDLLDLSRLESGGWTAASTPVSVAEIARESWLQLVESGAHKDIELVVEGDRIVLADASGLAQVFRNLLENSVRHTEPGGTIHVACTTPVAGTAEVAVSDDGEGIPSRALARIFERFYRADSSRARDLGGTGLGLAIVRHLVGAMGGEVWAESELGQGTTIRFTLPLEDG